MGLKDSFAPEDWARDDLGRPIDPEKTLVVKGAPAMDLAIGPGWFASPGGHRHSDEK